MFSADHACTGEDSNADQHRHTIETRYEFSSFLLNSQSSLVAVLESIILKTVDCETIDLYNQMVKSNDSCVVMLPRSRSLEIEADDDRVQ